jgi:hypothetical protein
VTAAGTTCVGSIHSFGACSRNLFQRTLPSQPGLNSCEAVSNIGRHSIGSFQMLHAHWSRLMMVGANSLRRAHTSIAKRDASASFFFCKIGPVIERASNWFVLRASSGGCLPKPKCRPALSGPRDRTGESQATRALGYRSRRSDRCAPAAAVFMAITAGSS